MLEDAAGIRRVVIACGYVDLRKGMRWAVHDHWRQIPSESF